MGFNFLSNFLSYLEHNPRTDIGLWNSTKNMGHLSTQKGSTVLFKYALTFLRQNLTHIFRLYSHNQCRF